MSFVSYIKQGENILIGFDGNTVTVGPDHLNYDKILLAIQEQRLGDLRELADVTEAIGIYSKNAFEITDGEVLYNGEVVHNVIADRLVELYRDGQEVDPLVLFLENLLDNPSESSREEMYLFLEHNNLPITPDGHFLAYKNVRENYTDIHSGTFDNSVGSVCEMPREAVNDNRKQTCSTGLHFCGLSYLSSFPGQHTMILKINPRDVVSIPHDYNNAKGRTCRYEVVGEYIDENRYEKDAFEKSVVDEYTEVAPTVDDIQAYKQEVSKEERGVMSFVKGLFNWMASRRVDLDD